MQHTEFDPSTELRGVMIVRRQRIPWRVIYHYRKHKRKNWLARYEKKGERVLDYFHSPDEAVEALRVKLRAARKNVCVTTNGSSS